MDFKDIVNFFGVVGTIAAPFTPAGAGVAMASNVLGKIAEFSDDSVKNDFIGLSALGSELKNMAETGEYDSEKIMAIAESLNTLSGVLNKFSKMIG